MQRDAKHLFRISVIILLFVIIGVYAFYQARKLIEGPRITIESPKNGETVYDSLLSIKGKAENINSISLDDRPIFIDEEGNINEKLLLYPGYNIMKIEAKDKFGKDRVVTLEVVYKAPEESNIFTDTASSSEATSTLNSTSTVSATSSTGNLSTSTGSSTF